MIETTGRVSIEVFHGIDANKTLSLTLDEALVTTTDNNIKFLPAGTPLGVVGGAKVIDDPSLKVGPVNTADAQVILRRDVYLDDGDATVTGVYGAVAYTDRINAACQEVFAANLAAAAKTALTDMRFRRS